MPGNFISPDGDLESIFVTEYQTIDQHAMTGSLWVWGLNSGGQLGDNTIASKSSPIQTTAGGTNWKQVGIGSGHAAAIKMDNTLWLWGENNYGQLGDNTLVPKSSPIQTIAGGTNWKQVVCGQRFAGAIKTNGQLWMWGMNSSGQLGNNAATNLSSPVQTVSGGIGWKQLAVGQTYSAAIKTDGTLWLWGANASGQLGRNNTTAVSSPVQTVAGGTNWKQVSTKYTTTAAIKTDGTLWVWGANTLGVLGNGVDVTNRSSPIQTIASGTNWKQVSVGGDHMGAIKTDGTLWLWGRGTSGQLGNGVDSNHYSSPIQTIAGGTNWKQISIGGTNVGHSAAIKTDGTLWAWGSSLNGQLGRNDRTSISSPAQTVASGTNWKLLDTYTNSTVAVYFYDANNLYPSA